MSDISDVQSALVTLAAQVLYPSGTGQPSAVGAAVKIYPGWPTAATLDADLAAGACHVTVFATAIERNVTRFPREWQQQSLGTATLTLTVAGQAITVGGQVSVPQNAMLRVGGSDYVYAVQAGDTLTGIATALAALVPGATNDGAVITLPADAILESARIGVGGLLVRELRRQQRVVKLTIWADTPAHRDAIAAALDTVLAKTDRITLPDQFSARVIYRGSPQTDSLQKTALYRRDLDYQVEFATTETTAATQVTQIETTLTPQDSGGVQIADAKVIFE